MKINIDWALSTQSFFVRYDKIGIPIENEGEGTWADWLQCPL